jgi:pimeloyl-ACP methyl ester carboxylesterase
MAADILLQHLGLPKRYHLLGHDIGDMVAASYLTSIPKPPKAHFW